MIQLMLFRVVCPECGEELTGEGERSWCPLAPWSYVYETGRLAG